MADVVVIMDERKCNDIVAHLLGVKQHLRVEAVKGAARVRAKLDMAPNRTGASTVEVETYDVDSHIILDDTASDNAAWMVNIETGALDAAF